MAHVFFGCSMRGGRDFVSRSELAEIANAIEALGHSLASHHHTKPGVLAEEDTYSKSFVYEREYKRMQASDCGIFEISNPSLGIGSGISDMLAMKKPVFCLYRNDLYPTISSYIIGRKGSSTITAPFDYYGYESLEGVRNKVEEFIKQHVAH